MIIRPATPQDASAIARVHVDSWRTTYVGMVPQSFLESLTYEARESYWQRALSNPDNPSFVYVAEGETGEVVGFVCGGPARDLDKQYDGELYAIYIFKEQQGKGIGRGLFNAVVGRLGEVGIRSMLLWVMRDNPACRFYEAMGGRKVGERQEEIGRIAAPEIAYGWDDTSIITGGHDSER